MRVKAGPEARLALIADHEPSACVFLIRTRELHNGLAFLDESGPAVDATFKRRRSKQFGSTSHDLQLGSRWFLMHNLYAIVHMPGILRSTCMSRAHPLVKVISAQRVCEQAT